MNGQRSTLSLQASRKMPQFSGQLRSQAYSFVRGQVGVESQAGRPFHVVHCGAVRQKVRIQVLAKNLSKLTNGTSNVEKSNPMESSANAMQNKFFLHNDSVRCMTAYKTSNASHKDSNNTKYTHARQTST